jgi:V/A-type H+-transporting ATPase subunit E
MAEELQGLLNRIREEGVAKAEAEGGQIVARAKAEAAELLARARTEAEALRAAAARDAELSRQKGEAALKQAARDLLIGLRKSIDGELTRTVGLAVEDALTPQTLTGILEHLVAAFAARGGRVEGLEVLLNAEDQKKLEALVVARFKDRLKEGVTLRPVPEIAGGVKVAAKGDALFFDFTAGAITDSLCAFVNPRIAALIREAGEK